MLKKAARPARSKASKAGAIELSEEELSAAEGAGDTLSLNFGAVRADHQLGKKASEK